MLITTHTGYIYRQNSDISHPVVGNKVIDHSDVVWASPVGAAPTTSSFSTKRMDAMNWAKTTARRDEKHSNYGFGATYIRSLTVSELIIWHSSFLKDNGQSQHCLVAKQNNAPACWRMEASLHYTKSWIRQEVLMSYPLQVKKNMSRCYWYKRGIALWTHTKTSRIRLRWL